jgi:hypothetical protein
MASSETAAFFANKKKKKKTFKFNANLIDATSVTNMIHVYVMIYINVDEKRQRSRILQVDDGLDKILSSLFPSCARYLLEIASLSFLTWSLTLAINTLETHLHCLPMRMD